MFYFNDLDKPFIRHCLDHGKGLFWNKNRSHVKEIYDWLDQTKEHVDRMLRPFKAAANHHPADKSVYKES